MPMVAALAVERVIPILSASLASRIFNLNPPWFRWAPSLVGHQVIAGPAL